MDWMSLIAIVISLVLIGFFSGIEIAFVSVSKLSIELRKKQGSYAGKNLGFLYGETHALYRDYAYSL